MEWSSLAPAILGLLLTLAILAFAAWRIWPIILKHMKGGGGWAALAQRFATEPITVDGALLRQTVTVGRVTYRNCVIVGLTDAGLYLATAMTVPLLRKPPLLIPWSQIESIEEVKLYWQEAAMLNVGNPLIGTVTVPAELLRAIRPWLPQARPIGSP